MHTYLYLFWIPQALVASQLSAIGPPSRRAARCWFADGHVAAARAPADDTQLSKTKQRILLLPWIEASVEGFKTKKELAAWHQDTSSRIGLWDRGNFFLWKEWECGSWGHTRRRKHGRKTNLTDRFSIQFFLRLRALQRIETRYVTINHYTYLILWI